MIFLTWKFIKKQMGVEKGVVIYLIYIYISISESKEADVPIILLASDRQWERQGNSKSFLWVFY